MTNELGKMRYQLNLLKLMLVLVLFNIGFALSWLFIGIYIFNLTSDLLLVTLFYSVSQTAWILGSMFWGYIADVHLKRKTVLGITNIMFGMFIIAFVFSSNPLILLFFFALSYFFAGGRIPSVNAYITVIEKSKGKAISKVMSAGSLGWFFGSLLSGFIFENLEPTILYLFSSLLVTTAGVIAFTLYESEKSSSKSNKSQLAVYLELLKNHIILVVCLIGLMMMISAYLVFSIFPVYVVNGLGGDPMTYAFASSIATITGAFVALALGHLSEKKRFGRFGAILFTITGYLIVFYLISTKDLFMALVAWALPIYPGIFIGSAALISDYTDENIRSRGMALFDSFQNFGIMVGYTLSTLVVFMFNIEDVLVAMSLFVKISMFIASVVLVLSFLVYYVLLKKKKYRTL